MSYKVYNVKSYNNVGHIVCVTEKQSWWFLGSATETTINCFFVPYKQLYQSNLQLNWSGSIIDSWYYQQHIFPLWAYFIVFALFLYFLWKFLYVFTIEFFGYILSFFKLKK